MRSTSSSLPIAESREGKQTAIRLSPDCSGFSDIADIITQASTSWLKNEEVLAILEFFVERRDTLDFPQVAALQPEGGSLFIFSRSRCRSFRADKHPWRTKKDNKTIKETHEKLKVGVKETLNCYYAHAESGDGLQRRCYWILDKALDDVVMVHYLCANTTRISAPRGGRETGEQTVMRARSRPQRAASLKARFAGLYSSDSDELDRGKGRKNATDASSVGAPGPVNEGFEDAELDAMDSFIAKLPDDLGTFASKDLLLETLTDDFGLTHEQLSMMLAQGATSPGKEPGLSMGPSALLAGTSISKEDLLGMLATHDSLFASRMMNPKGAAGTGAGGANAQRQTGRQHPSLQVSGVDSILKGYSRLESLDGLSGLPSKIEDFPIIYSGFGGEDSDKPPEGAEDKVSTIRRVLAPAAGGSGQSHFQSLSGSLSHPAEFDRKTRVNPTATVNAKDAGKTKAEAAKDKADFNLQRRESLLRKVRNRKDDAAGDALTDDDRHNSSGDILYQPSNVLFRSSSHLVSKQDLNMSPEKARVLLKTMSIDDRDDVLSPGGPSVEMKQATVSTVLEDSEESEKQRN